MGTYARGAPVLDGETIYGVNLPKLEQTFRVRHVESVECSDLLDDTICKSHFLSTSV